MKTDALTEFVRWAYANITGDEKGQAHIFLDRLFRALGQPGCLDVGGEPECRIRKAAEDGGGTAFADYVWKPHVLIEMKKRGVDLRRHYRQAFDYWTRLVPNRPRYVILCNFDEFHIYDFETQMDAPVDTVALHELPKRHAALAFLAPGNPAPLFDNDRVAVTRKAADHLAYCFNNLVSRRTDRALAQRFILQMLVALFSEDIGLLEKNFVTRLLAECTPGTQSYDLIGGLFRAMNTNPPEAGGRYKGVPYFNGGLFADPARIELDETELNHLREAAREDWSKVQPEIFGTLFQHSMDAGERHAFGAHFTHPADIMKIVGPTIVEPWRAQIEGAKTLARLDELLNRLHNFRVLDPACGSGNFLYIAYRELKRLEARLYERMETEFSSQKGKVGESQSGKVGEQRLSFLSARNFYGLDILPFAVEIAKVTMMIARKLAIDEVHVTESALPLDNLDANFIAADALLTQEGLPAVWPKADVIIGNPPFLGAKRLKPEHGPVYVNKLRRAYPKVPGMADFCVYWIRKAADHLPPCTTADPLTGRAGLVGTQNIRNNQSRIGGLDHVVKTGTIVEAVDNQPWSGEANVHVSIANWVKTQEAALLPAKRKLWYKVEPVKSTVRRKRGQGSASKEYDLDVRDCSAINSALSDKANVSDAVQLRCNTEKKLVYQGVTPGHDGFVLTPKELDELAKDGVSNEVIRSYLTGREIVTGNGTPERCIIDFQRRSILEIQQFPNAFGHVQRLVLPDIKRKAVNEHDSENARKAHLDRWWMLWRDRKDMFEGFTHLSGRFIACSRVTKRPIFVTMSTKVWPSDKVQAFLFDDDYSFGILQSQAHWQWFLEKCSKLKADFSYSIESVFDTFPWPQSPTAKQIEAVAAAGCEIRRIRAETLPKLKGGLRALYRTLELPGKNPLKDAHVALDAAVLDAYGFTPKADLLAQLLALNQEVASRIAASKPVTAPGLPPSYPTPEKLVTPDCIQAP